MGKVDIYLKDKGSIFRFPVLPEEVSVRKEKLLDTFTILEIGEVDKPVGEKVEEIQFGSFFPEYFDTYCNYADFPPPLECVRQINDWFQAEEPIRMVITGFDINCMVLIASFEPVLRADDIYFDIIFRGYKELTPVRQSKNTGRTEENKPDNSTYTVRSNDTLTSIAKTQLGDSSKWQVIAKNNGISNPEKLPIGTKLVIK